MKKLIFVLGLVLGGCEGADPLPPNNSNHCQQPMVSYSLCRTSSGALMEKNDSTCAVCLPLSINDCLIANHTAPLCVSDCGECGPAP